MCRIFAKLNVAFFARKYPAVQDAFLKSLLEVSVKYYKALAGEKVRCFIGCVCVVHMYLRELVCVYVCLRVHVCTCVCVRARAITLYACPILLPSC